MKVSVIGQGYVGLNVAIGAAKAGHTVLGIDVDSRLINDLSQGTTYVPGINQSEILDLIKSKNYLPLSGFKKISECEIIVIAVPTPLNKNRDPDLSFLELASKEIGHNLNSKALIVNESTSYPGTLRNFIKPLIESISSVKHLYASAPERIDPGNTTWLLTNTPRVIGGLTKDATELAIEFYQTFCGEIYQVSAPEVAEASKLFENSFRQVNIALANEFSKISHALGFSANEAIRAASTKPFGFMPFWPGIGTGGHCIPVDPIYLTYSSNLAGTQGELIELATKTNFFMVDYVVNRILHQLMKPISQCRIQVAGIAYKVGIPDLRESPSLELISKLRALGAIVIWHDPVVGTWEDEVSHPLETNIDLGIVITPHNQIDFLIWRNSDLKILDISAISKDFGWPKFL